MTTGATGCTDCQPGKYYGCQSDTTWEPAGGVYPEWIGRACELFVGYEQMCESEGACPYCCECAGYCSNAPKPTCNWCPSGKYSDVSASTLCTNCPPGKYSGVTGANHASTCSNCPANSYSSASGASACIGCDAGKTSTAGASVCVSAGCAAGTYVSGGGCTNCAPGSYSTVTSASACTGCSAGTYSGVTGASSPTVCTNCLAGTYSSVAGASSSTMCTSCTAGKYSGAAGASSSTVCTNCAAGKYSGTAGATSSTVCTNCPAGAYSGTAGASSSTVCTSCTAGKYSGTAGASSSTVCTNCAAGKYSSVAGATSSTVCTNCLAGTYSSVAGASSSTACSSCPAGQTTNAGESVCTSITCPAGTYLSGSVCTNCPAGAYSSTVGATASTVCINCLAGAYSSTVGATASTVCINCLAGTYSVVTGGNSVAVCNNCPAGSYAAVAGASACVSCPINTFSAVSASVCQPCQANALSPAGSVSQTYCYCKSGYAHAAGAYTCRICDPGTWNSQLGRTACSNCSVGLYSVHYGAVGNETCLSCPLGQWSPEGSPNCNLCPVNSFAGAGSGSQTNCNCNAGYTGPNGGLCSACAAGQYKNATGAATCVSCPVGSTSPNASSSVSNCTCSPGYVNVADVCTAVITRAVRISGTLTTVTTDSSPGDIAAAMSQFRYQIAAMLGIPVGLVQIERTYLNSGRALLSTEITIVLTISARSTTELNTLAAATADLSTIAGLSGASQTIVEGTTPLSNLTCSACPANSYYAQGQCVSCMNNTVSVPGSLACQCEAGFTGTAGACQACPAGTYKRMAGTSACRSCQANSMSDAASVLCSCNPGYTAKTGDVCVACVAGKYKNTTGTAECTSCAGNRNSIAASTNVTACVCNIGYTQVENAEMPYDAVYAQSCVSCDIGKFKPLIGVQACTACGLNQFSVTASPICSCINGFTGPDGGPCAECALGKYKDWLGSQACTTCPANSYTPVTGNTRLINCTCNMGYTGPNGGPCNVCVGGTYKNVTGSSVCLSCSADFYSTLGTAATSCTACKTGFKSLSVSGDVSDCCDPNTTIARSPFFTLSAATQAALGYYYSVRVSSTPLFGLRSMTGTVGKMWGPFQNLPSPSPASVAPTYIASGGYNNQAYLSFRKPGGVVQYMDTDEVPITFENGMTFVTVVRFLDYVQGTRYLWVGSLVSFMFPDRSLGFEVYLTDRGAPECSIQLCVGRGFDYFNEREWAQSGQTADRSICSGDMYTCAGSTIPFNEWLTVTFTYGGNSNPLHTLKVTYQLPSGVEVVVASKSAFVNGGLQNTPTMAQTLSRINSPTYACNYVNGQCSGNFDASKYVLGYNTNLQCMHSAYGSVLISDIVTVSGGCNRPDFDLAGLYLMQTIASTADIAVIVQAIRSGSQLAYDKTYCPCNAGFGGTGRSDCKSCSPGSYNSEVRSAPCSLCPVNMYSNAVEALDIGSCLSCPEGTVSRPGEIICFCAAGSTGPNFGPCVACDVGKYKNWRNSSECVACPPNSDSVPGTSLCPCNVGYTGPLGGPCVACVAGKYKNTNGTAACTTCPANSYEPDVAAVTVTNCTCNTGFDGADGGPCTGCALGKYKNNNDTTPCVECPVDTYIDVQSSAYCKACPEFTTSPSGSTSIASCICKLGYTGGGGAVTVGVPSSNLGRSCGVNYNEVCLSSQSTTRGSQPSSAALDTILDTISHTEAGGDQWFRIDFGRAVYVQSVAIVILRAHEVDYHRNIQVRVGNVDSYSSNPTCYVHSGSLTTLGGGTSYWARELACTTPREGRYLYYVNPDGLNYVTFAEFSPKGFLNAPKVACSACAIGKYKDVIGSAMCTSCPSSTFSGANNATSIETCTSCPGNSTSLLGSASKDYCQCNVGFIHEGAGCAACLPGTFNPRLAQIACSNCTVGTYSLNYGAVSNETCASCKETEYSPEGSALCQPCPPNSVAAAGSSKIQDCGCTYGYTGASASLCEKCAQGKFKNITGNWLCQSCSVNSYSLSGATALTACFCDPGYTGAYGPFCVACALGKYKSIYGSSACIDCPVNTYADRTGMTVCTSCVNTSASAVASFSIWNCTCNAGYKGPTYEDVVAHDNFARSCGDMRNSPCAATQSSTLTTQVAEGIFEFMNPAQLANDNSSSTFSTTAFGTNQWWRVDFERRVTVNSVSLLFSRFAIDMLHVHVGDVNSSIGNLMCASIAVNSSSTDWTTTTCASSLTGRYLYVRNSIASQVTLQEVQVQGTEVLVKIWPDWCEKCPVGTYKTVTGNLPCDACPSNRFSTSLAATSISTCLSCPANSVSVTGSDQCACDLGFSGPANACIACASATFKTDVGSASCATCPANSVIAANASTAAMPCTCLSGFEPR